MDVSRPFLVSSPSNGIESEQEGYVAQSPADVRFGDGRMAFTFDSFLVNYDNNRNWKFNVIWFF